MGQITKIQWTDHTFNPWRGCTKVSAGCKHCYAEKLALRNPAVLGIWGDQGTRAIAAETYWGLPGRWNREAKAACRRAKVFCLSLGDWLEDREDLDRPRARLLATVARTPMLDWLLLTKRPENFRRCLGRAWNVSPSTRGAFGAEEMIAAWLDGQPPANVWAGFSAEDQTTFWQRLNPARDIPALVHFVSMEPLLGPIDIQGLTGIDWIIVGGESESEAKARPFDIGWAQSIVDLCRTAGIACFVKQLGSNVEATDIDSIDATDDFPGDVSLSRGTRWAKARVRLQDPKGGDPDEWPKFLRVREFPSAR